MFHTYSAKPSLFTNALLLSGALLLAVATHWSTLSVLAGA